MTDQGIFRNHREDGEANPLFWGPYRFMFQRLGKLLTQPGMRLTQVDCDKAGPFAISVLSQNVLEWNHFDFTRADRQESLFGLPIGKSANIDFTLSAGLTRDEIDMDMVTDAVLKRNSKPSDHIYGAHVSAIENAGWQAHWTPLVQNPLHVLLIPQQSFIESNFEPRKRDKQNLVNNFWLIK